MTLADRINELVKQHGSVRAVARVMKMDHSYLWHLSVGSKTEPSERVLRKLWLKRVVTYKRTTDIL